MKPAFYYFAFGAILGVLSLRKVKVERHPALIMAQFVPLMMAGFTLFWPVMLLIGASRAKRKNRK